MLASLVIRAAVGRLQRVPRAAHRATLVHHHPRYAIDASRRDDRLHAAGHRTDAVVSGLNGVPGYDAHPHHLRQRRHDRRRQRSRSHRVVARRRRPRHLGAAAHAVRQLDLRRRRRTQQAARNVGVPVSLVKIVLFMGTAVAAWLVRDDPGRSRARSADVAARHRQRVLPRSSPPSIGGMLLTGGYGSAIGAVFGALIFGMVTAGHRLRRARRRLGPGRPGRHARSSPCSSTAIIRTARDGSTPMSQRRRRPTRRRSSRCENVSRYFGW